MSDYRDPRDPINRDPLYGGLNDPSVTQMRSQAIGPGMALAWFVGLVLFIGILVFAFGGAENPQVADTETGQTSPTGVTRNGAEPAPSTQPPANNPAPAPKSGAQ